MEFLGINEFSLLTLLAGGIFLVTGYFYNFHPPKIPRWYTLQLKTANLSNEVFQEAIRFAAKPIAVSGIILLLSGLLPIFFFKPEHFTLELASILIFSICIGLSSKINRHIKQLFEDKKSREVLH